MKYEMSESFLLLLEVIFASVDSKGTLRSRYTVSFSKHILHASPCRMTRLAWPEKCDCLNHLFNFKVRREKQSVFDAAQHHLAPMKAFAQLLHTVSLRPSLTPRAALVCVWMRLEGGWFLTSPWREKGCPHKQPPQANALNSQIHRLYFSLLQSLTLLTSFPWNAWASLFLSKQCFSRDVMKAMDSPACQELTAAGGER